MARVDSGEDLVTGWCSLLLVLGLYLDGWNRNGLRGDASRPFLTPWHALLYAGLVATAAWILTQGQRRGAWSLRAVPAGYRLGLTGIGLAIVAVATDATWHLRHVEEQGPAGLTLALLMWPPAVPLTAWNRARSATARSAATPTPMPARMVGR
jgi:hypothetical protein